MPNLTVNGYALKTALNQFWRANEEVMADRDRSQSGAYGTSRFALKRRWAGETPPRLFTEWTADRALLYGLGERWAFTPTSTTGSRFTEEVAGAVRTLRTAETVGTVAIPKYGDACVAVEGGTTNLLTTNQRDGTEDASTIGFTAEDGATISSSTAQAWQGSRSLQVVTSGTVNAVRGGVRTNDTAGLANTAYRGTAYVRASTGSPQVRVLLRDDKNGIDGTAQTLTLSATGWTRFDVGVTTGALAPDVTNGLRLRVLEETADAAITFYCDGLQVEAESFATSWVNGTRADGTLIYRPGWLQSLKDFTIMSWTQGPTSLIAVGTEVILVPQSGFVSGGPYIELRASGSGSSNNLVLAVRAAGQSETTITKASAWDGNWHHIAAVVRESSSRRIELFYDGSTVGNSAPAVLPLSGLSTNELRVGVRNSDRIYNGLVDDLVVLPYAATAAQISAWYSAGAAFSSLPKLNASGDALGGEAVEVLGLAPEAIFDPFWSTGVWQNSAARLRLELREI